MAHNSDVQLDLEDFCDKTPNKKMKRLPREYSGTKLARERKKMLNAIRQKRRRARRKAEKDRERLLGNASSGDEGPVPCQEEVGHADIALDDLEPEGEAGALDDEETDLPALEYSNMREIELVERRRQTAEELLAFRLARQEQDESELDNLAKEFATIKVTSCVSDAAMDKMFKMFVRHNGSIMRMIESGDIRDSYSKSIRPIVVSKLLPIYSSLLIKEEDPARGHLYRRIEGLQVVPAEYYNLPADGSKQLLRTETYVKLADLKEHFLATHGRTAANMQLLKNCSLSVDGVKESNKGSRSFVFVTMRIGTCLYLVKAFHPLIGVADSKPTPKELLR